MGRVLQVLVESPRSCSYLPDRLASLEHRVIVDATGAELEAMLERGWRRFGPDHFRPACAPCSSCVPTRISLSRFAPAKTMRRVARAAAELRLEVGVPTVDRARLALHAKWHAFRESERGWSESFMTPREYALSFAFPHEAVRELAYYDDAAPGGARLVGIGITDETPSAWSAVYFFYDPDYAHRSLGVVNVLRQVELARARGKEHLYLGYLVEGCPSMEYKARYGPRERLVGWPADGEPPRWVPA